MALLISLQHKSAVEGGAAFNAVLELLLHKAGGILERWTVWLHCGTKHTDLNRQYLQIM